MNVHHHIWIVFSTEVTRCCLMLECAECGTFGTVDDPTIEEWGQAFHAPSNPYPWTDNARVIVRDNNVVYQRSSMP